MFSSVSRTETTRTKNFAHASTDADLVCHRSMRARSGQHPHGACAKKLNNKLYDHIKRLAMLHHPRLSPQPPGGQWEGSRRATESIPDTQM